MGREFNPYINNGGTVIAVATGNRVVVGCDTRLSQGYSIVARDYVKVTQLTSKCVIATSGMTTDSQALHKLLKARVTMYQQMHSSEPSTAAMAQLLSNTLYSRRFFPYYTFNLLCGLSESGEGVIYGYDAIGSYDVMQYGAQGSGIELVIPVLDNQMTGRNQLIPTLVRPGENGLPQYRGDPLELVKDAMTSCAERDINTGDSVELFDISEQGIERSAVALRFD